MGLLGGGWWGSPTLGLALSCIEYGGRSSEQEEQGPDPVGRHAQGDSVCGGDVQGGGGTRWGHSWEVTLSRERENILGGLRQRGQQVQRPRGKDELGVLRVREGPEWSGGRGGGREAETDRDTERRRDRGAGVAVLTTYGGRVAGGLCFPTAEGRRCCLGETPREPRSDG